MSIGPWVFNFFDVIVLLVVFISLAMAASRGVFRELISIAALLASIVASLFVWGRFRTSAQDFIQPKELADIVLGAGTFVLVYMLMLFLLSGATKALRGKEVGFIDRIGGAAFGGGRGLLVMSLFVMYFTADYREAQDVQSLSTEQREVLETMPKAIRDMVNLDREVELPAMFQDSTFYPLLDKIGAGIRALPFAQFKSMASKLKDGEDLGQIIKDADL